MTENNNNLPNCIKCSSEFVYKDGELFVCPECFYEWSLEENANTLDENLVVKDSNGNLLANGDTVILIKDLKLKGSSTVLKKGSKAKSIRLVDGDHEIDCKVDGVKIMLKACFVKKA